MKWRHFSSASATARASPSIAAYLDSAAWVGPDQSDSPAIFAAEELSGTMFLKHPVSDAWLICSMMICLDSSWCSVVQVNFVDGCSKSLKGAIVVAREKVYATWFTRPNHERTSVVEEGVGNSAMAFVNFLAGLTVDMLISKPANCTVSCANWVIPLVPHRVSRVVECLLYVRRPYQSVVDALCLAVYPSPEAPGGGEVNGIFPRQWWMWWSGCPLNAMGQNDTRSKRRTPTSSSAWVCLELDGKGWWVSRVAWAFNGWKSITHLGSPFDFPTIIILWHQVSGVPMGTFSMTPRRTFTLPSQCTGTEAVLWATTGVASGSMLRGPAIMGSGWWQQVLKSKLWRLYTGVVPGCLHR